MGVLLWFAPWAVYWVLAGNAAPLIAAAVALAAAVAVLVGWREPPARILGIGAVATFVVAAVLPPAWDGAPRWLLPLSFAGLLATVATSMVAGRSVVESVVKADVPTAVVQSELFGPIVNRVRWIWLGALAAMTVSAVCSWVIPFGILTAAAIGSRIVAEHMTAGFGDAVRKTSFVAFVDLEIDQLYYLAQEHANREVGAGEQAYNVTVGAKGTPLLGDDTRVSWPSTYKVRPRR